MYDRTRALVVVGRQLDGSGPVEILQRGTPLNDVWSAGLEHARVLTVKGAKSAVSNLLNWAAHDRRFLKRDVPNYSYLIRPVVVQPAGEWTVIGERSA